MNVEAELAQLEQEIREEAVDPEPSLPEGYGSVSMNGTALSGDFNARDYVISTGNATTNSSSYNINSSPNSSEMSFNTVSDDPEKIALIEKLIKQGKITLKEGLLLLGETSKVITNTVRVPEYVSQPYIAPQQPYYQQPIWPGTPQNPPYTFTSGSSQDIQGQ